MNKKELNSLFDDAIDELEVTYDRYFEIERYRPRCVHVARYLLSGGIKQGRVLVLGSNEVPFTMLFKKLGFQTEGFNISRTLKNDREDEREKELSTLQLIRNLPGGYDIIICDDMLQGLEFPSATLDALKSHMGPGGMLILTTPNAARGDMRLRLLAGRNVFPWPDDNLSYEPEDGGEQRLRPYREYTLRELEILVKNAGFELIRSQFIIGKNVNAKMWPPLPVKEYLLGTVFHAVQKIASPLRTYLFAAARRTSSQGEGGGQGKMS